VTDRRTVASSQYYCGIKYLVIVRFFLFLFEIVKLPVMRSCEHGNKPSASIKSKVCLYGRTAVRV
jgi:hypothetical protein